MIRQELEISENKRLIEKQQKLDAIVEQLKAQHAEEAEIHDVMSIMSASELTQIKLINEISNK